MYFLLLLTLNLISLIQTQGVPSTRVAGGIEVSPKFKYSWMVTIQKKFSLTTTDSYHSCGGILLNKNTVLTAAHCTSDSNLNNYLIYIHRHNLTKSLEEERGIEAQLTNIYTEGFEPIELLNDLAILKIQPKTSFNFEPIYLDKSNSLVNPDSKLLAIGWGVTSNTSGISKVLNEVTIPVVSFSNCSTYWNGQGYYLKEPKQVCAGGQGGKDVCSGDSGGPLFLKKDGKFTLVGVTSFGESCARKGAPTVFTKVFGYLPFIEKYLK